MYSIIVTLRSNIYTTLPQQLFDEGRDNLYFAFLVGKTLWKGIIDAWL